MKAMESLFSDIKKDRCLSDIDKSLLDGVLEHHHNLAWELSVHYTVANRDYAKINVEANKWFSDYLNGDAIGNVARDKMIFDSLYELRRAVDHLLGKNYAVFSNSLGLSCAQLAKYQALKSVDRKLPRFEAAIKKASSKNAVSQRSDQLLKPNWVEHVKNCVAHGYTIHTLNDLLEIEGYDHNCSKITRTTLKSWAKEAVPNLIFRAGAPRLKK